MEKFAGWIDKNSRNVWLFIGAVLLALAVDKPLVASAVYLLGLALIPKEG